MTETLVLEEVVRGWTRWVTSADGVRTRRRWAAESPALAGWETGELAAPRSSPRTDAMQRALVARAQRGDQHAALTLLTQLRPGLEKLARRTAATNPHLSSLDEAAAEVLGVCGERIMRHSLDRRPTGIAANLLLDTKQRIWRAGTRYSRIVDAAIAAAPTEAEPSPLFRPDSIVGELDLVAAVASAVARLPGSERSRRMTAELAFRTWILDQPTGAIARELGLAREAASSRLCRLRSLLRRELTSGPPPAPAAQLPASQLTSSMPGSAPAPRSVGPSLAKRQ